MNNISILKKILLLLLLGLFLYSCDKDEAIDSELQERNSNLITEDLAMTIAKNFNFETNSNLQLKKKLTLHKRKSRLKKFYPLKMKTM